MTENEKTESVQIQRAMAGGPRSRLARYGALIVGRPGWWPLLKYELIMLVCSGVPGALGLWLRAKLYPLLLGQCGRGVVFGAQVALRHPHKIAIGDDVIIDDYCLLDAKGRVNQGIRIGAGSFIGRHSILSCKNGDIVLGARVNIGFNAEIFSGSRVTVGDDTLLAAYCYLIGGDHASDDLQTAVGEQGARSRGIEVGDQAWFGAGALVLDGVRVGHHCIVGAGAVVTRDLPAYSVSVGMPARVIRDRRAADASAPA